MSTRYFGSLTAPELSPEWLLAVPWSSAGRCFYASRDGAVTAGLGEAATLTTEGPDRIERLADRADALFATLRPCDDGALVPPLVGGFAFADGTTANVGPWAGWPSARLVLPEVTLVRRGASQHLIAVAPEGLERGAARAVVQERLERALDGLLSAALAGSTAEAQAPWGFATDESAGGPSSPYESLVARALLAIDAGPLRKVTVARAHRFGRVRGTAPVDVLRAFARRYVGCFRFWVEPAGAAPFAGASPERLVAQDGHTLRADALAGTVGRAEDPGADAQLGALLLANGKERREHEAVVEFLRERLGSVAELGGTVEAASVPVLLQVANVLHLHTPFTARLSEAGTARGVLRHAAAVHPTPAVAGVPADDARGFIALHEGLNRGWYSGGVGVVERGGNGEICVAIRSGVFEQDALWLFAGAGIVAGSDPAREGREVEQKMRALRDLLVVG